MSNVSALYLESFRPEFWYIYLSKCPLSRIRSYLKHVSAGTTDLNNLREKVDYIKIKSPLWEDNWDGYSELWKTNYMAENSRRTFNIYFAKRRTIGSLYILNWCLGPLIFHARNFVISKVQVWTIKGMFTQLGCNRFISKYEFVSRHTL